MVVCGWGGREEGGGREEVCVWVCVGVCAVVCVGGRRGEEEGGLVVVVVVVVVRWVVAFQQGCLPEALGVGVAVGRNPSGTFLAPFQQGCLPTEWCGVVWCVVCMCVWCVSVCGWGGGGGGGYKPALAGNAVHNLI